EPTVIHFEIVMIVPRLPRAVPDLDEAHAALDEPPRDENLPRLGSFSIHFADVFRLARDVERVGGVRLHAIRQFEGLDARLELRVLLVLPEMALVELLQQIKLLLLFRERGV